MSKLSFTSNFKSWELQRLDFPIEVRKPNLALVARTLLSQTVEIPPGTYHVMGRLPAGQQLYAKVNVKESETALADLSPELEDESSHESHEVQHFLRETMPKVALETLGATPVVGRLRRFIGNPLAGKVLPDTRAIMPSSQTENTIQFRLSGANEIQIVQLLQPALPPLNVLMPVGLPENQCLLMITQKPNGECELTIHLGHTAADLLLGYRERNYLEEAAMATSSPALRAEHLLYDKIADPVAAAVGAYALLRFGDLDRLHDWTENLKNWFPWLPDGLTIRAEHLARCGEHEAALIDFLALSDRGLPIFTEGLSYAIDRLRLYVNLGMQTGASSVWKIDSAKAQSLLEQLQQFGGCANLQQPLLTYTGIDPAQPDKQSFSGDIEDYDGIELPQFSNR